MDDAWIRLSEDPQRLQQLTSFDCIKAAVEGHNSGQNRSLDASWPPVTASLKNFVCLTKNFAKTVLVAGNG